MIGFHRATGNRRKKLRVIHGPDWKFVCWFRSILAADDQTVRGTQIVRH